MMRMMTADYFARSPLMILPVIALVIFLAVFVGIVLRTYLGKRGKFDDISKLPLDEGE